ncbi:MAG: thermostable hemolysin [Chromatiales bacterium]|jgi:hypothetical protein
MRPSVKNQPNACIVAGVQPLLTELRDDVRVHYCHRDDDGRERLESFIQDIFELAYGARLTSFYPNLTAFTTAGCLRGVIGYRDGMVKPLFSEQYLDRPIEKVMTESLGEQVDRRLLVEVGNLALLGPGEARWVIAAITAFLHAAGYRWVLFTAVKSLFNAFQRLGLKPVRIATPDPKRLPDGGRNWGRYYQAGPMVCAGDIEAGWHKLNGHVSIMQPKLYALLREASALGMHSRYRAEHVLGEAG